MAGDEARPALFTPEAGIGVPLAVAGVGFAVLVLGMANARWFNPARSGSSCRWRWPQERFAC